MGQVIQLEDQGQVRDQDLGQIQSQVQERFEILNYTFESGTAGHGHWSINNSMKEIDWLVFGVTLTVSIFIGFYFAWIKKQKTPGDLLLGSQSMSVVPTAFSFAATIISAFIVLGNIGSVYAQGTLIAEMVFAFALFAPLGAFLFFPPLFNLELKSTYEYLELRFDSVTIRWMSTLTFMVQVYLIMGVVVYVPALALEAVTNFPTHLTMIVIGLGAGVLSGLGGFRAVVWSDVFQILLMTALLLAIIIQGSIDIGGFGKAFSIAHRHGRIEFFKMIGNPFTNHSSLNIFFGTGVQTLAALGCHQARVQRFLSIGSRKRALYTLALGVPIVAIMTFLSIAAGVVVFANYAGCDPVSLGLIDNSDQISPYFVLQHLSPCTGLLGLFIAFIFAGTLSTASGGVSCLTTCTWEDFLKKLKVCKELTEARKGIVTRIISFCFGLLIIGMGVLASQMGGVFAAIIIINGTVSGPLLGIFLLGFLFPFANETGAIVGLIVGHVVSLWIAIGGLIYSGPEAPIPFSIDQCDQATLDHVENITLIMQNFGDADAICPTLEWPEKIYSLSYMLYPLVGCTSTLVTAGVVSLITGRTKMTKELEPYIHPWIVKLTWKLRNATQDKKNEADWIKTNDFECNWDGKKVGIKKNNSDYISYYDYDDYHESSCSSSMSTLSTITMNSTICN